MHSTVRPDQLEISLGKEKSVGRERREREKKVGGGKAQKAEQVESGEERRERQFEMKRDLELVWTKDHQNQRFQERKRQKLMSQCRKKQRR